jgi:hypothetical protein
MIAEIRENHLTFMAGSLAFYAFVSLVPLFVLAFVAASVIGGEAFATRITGLLESTLTESARDLLADVLTDSSSASRPALPAHKSRANGLAGFPPAFTMTTATSKSSSTPTAMLARSATSKSAGR